MLPQEQFAAFASAHHLSQRDLAGPIFEHLPQTEELQHVVSAVPEGCHVWSEMFDGALGPDRHRPQDFFGFVAYENHVMWQAETLKHHESDGVPGVAC